MSGIIGLRAALPAVAADFDEILRASTPSVAVFLVLLDDTPDPEVNRLLPDQAEWRSDRDQDLLLLIGDSATALDTALPDSGSLAVEVASVLQDHAMDTMNRPWPLVRRVDGPAVVVEPALLQGAPRWAFRGAALAALGDLASIE